MPTDDITIRARDQRFANSSVFGSVLVSWDARLTAVGPDGSTRLPVGCAVFARAFPDRYEVTEVEGQPARAPVPAPTSPPAPPAVTVPLAAPPPPPPAPGLLSFNERAENAVKRISANKQRAALRMRTVADAIGIKGAGASYAEHRDAVLAAFATAGKANDRAAQQRIVEALEAEAGA